MGTVKFALLSWFSIVRDVWRQQFSVLSEKTNNNSVVSSHFHLYLRISALRLPTVTLTPRQNGHHFSDEIFKSNLSYYGCCILFQIVLQLFLVFQLIMNHHWLNNGLAPGRGGFVAWTNVGVVLWRTYASFEPRWVNRNCAFNQILFEHMMPMIV